jgi:hypothetical protein
MTVGANDHQILTPIILAIAVEVMENENLKVWFTAHRAPRTEFQNRTSSIFSNQVHTRRGIEFSPAFVRTKVMLVRAQF